MFFALLLYVLGFHSAPRMTGARGFGVFARGFHGVGVSTLAVDSTSVVVSGGGHGGGGGGHR